MTCYYLQGTNFVLDGSDALVDSVSRDLRRIESGLGQRRGWRRSRLAGEVVTAEDDVSIHSFLNVEATADGELLPHVPANNRQQKNTSILNSSFHSAAVQF